jgi:hypothetical protein
MYAPLKLVSKETELINRVPGKQLITLLRPRFRVFESFVGRGSYFNKSFDGESN